MKDKELFKKFMAGLAELFDKNLSQTLSDIYWAALKDFSDEQCKNAFNKAMVQCKFFPKPVELIEMVSGALGKLEDIALLQADIVVNTIKIVGGYQSVLFKDGVTNAVIQNCFGGWMKICTELMESNEQWFRKDFIKYYQSYHRQKITSTEPLVGIVYTRNSANGFEEYTDPPILIDGFEIDKTKLIEE